MSRIILAVFATLTLGSMQWSAATYAGSLPLNSELNATAGILDLSPSVPNGLSKKSTTQGSLATDNLMLCEAATISSDVEMRLAVSPQIQQATTLEVATAGAGLHPIGLMVAVATTAIIPEPSTVVLMGLGAAGMLYAGLRRRRPA